MHCCWRQASVTPLIPWTFLTRHTARHALARFLRGNERGRLLDRTADSDPKTSNLIAFSMLILAQSQPKENRHETFDHLAIAAGRLRRPEHDGSERRRLRCRRIPGRLRRGGAPRCRGCAASRRCRPASDCRAPQGLLIFVRSAFVLRRLSLLTALYALLLM
jgi:hypothetical protein